MSTDTSHPEAVLTAPQLTELRDDKVQHQHGAFDASEQAAMFADLAALTVDEPPTIASGLRAMSTPMRIVAALFAVIGMGSMGAMMGIRPDMAQDDVIRVGVMLASLLGLMAVMVAVALRGYHQAPLGPRAWAAIGVGLGVPALLALFPGLWASGAAAAAPGAHMCFTMGSFIGLMAGGMVWLFQRGDGPASWRFAAAACAGGLAGFAALQVTCPSREIGHVLLGHAGVGFALAAVAVVYATGRRKA